MLFYLVGILYLCGFVSIWLNGCLSVIFLLIHQVNMLLGCLQESGKHCCMKHLAHLNNIISKHYELMSDGMNL